MKRVPALFVLVAMVLSLVVAAPGGADTDSAPPPADLPDQPAPTIESDLTSAELEDLAVAAKEFGLSIEEAIDQYGWRDNFSLMAATVAINFPDDFARSEIVDGRLAWVAFAGEQPASSAALIERFQSAFPHVTVEVRTNAGFSATELNEAVMAVHERVMSRPDVVDAVTEYWSPDETIQVTVAGDPSEQVTSGGLTADLEALDSLIPDSVALDVTVSTAVVLGGDDSWTYHYGGEALSSCTSGFGTRDFSSTSGTRGISTAGHCGNTLTDDGRTLNYQSGYDGNWGDYQWHTGVGSESDDFYSGNSSTLEVNRRDVSSVAWASPGDWVCTNGKTTHKECDTVRNSGVCHAENCNMFGMTNREQSGGDSGGPVFYNYGARGLHEGWYNSGGAQRDTKSQANYMPSGIFAWVATS